MIFVNFVLKVSGLFLTKQMNVKKWLLNNILLEKKQFQLVDLM